MMDSNLMRIEDAAASLLSSLDTTVVERSTIDGKVRAIASIQGQFSEEDIQMIIRRLEERFSISMNIGLMFAADDYRPWLDDERGNIDWYYWGRYKRYLANDERYSPHVIRTLDNDTERILDHLENPHKNGKWMRKGMVVGHVQSGKTGNYIGLINKAADSGYKVIIVLGGMLNSLRNQTQIRLDTGFLGVDSKTMTPVGVGKISGDRKPANFTTREQDFSKKSANQIGVGIQDLVRPVLLVIKKNKTTLDNLIDWLKHNNRHNLKDHPVLLIDDEADLGSINTSREGDEATAINRKIRQLLHLFDRSSYVGYTATPFANVFIDPETETEMLGDDLFPRDFIISLDAPSNYIGPNRIFSSNADLDLIREVEDFEDDLPAKHGKEWQPPSIPQSLKDAIEVFVLARAIRLARGQTDSHNSMLVNVSRFTRVQSNVKLLIDEYLREVRQAIISYYRLDTSEFLKHTALARLKVLFDREFGSIERSWPDIQLLLKDAISPISVVEVNSSPSATPLDYSRQNYPNGRNVIAVGGMNLSRGLTLEGLTISYFLRNSVMYDTLMQMGRWFGYREGYADLCRIYMTSETASWYGHISDASDELRGEFRRMQAAGMSPSEFGLCVRSHPESLIITARNKMRTGKAVLRQVSLEGRLVETSVLLNITESVRNNLAALESVVRNADRGGTRLPSEFGFLWKGVPSEIVVEFIERFENHPYSQLTESRPLIDYIRLCDGQGPGSWDVILVSPKGAKSEIETQIGEFLVAAQVRTVVLAKSGRSIEVNKRRVASRGLERAGLSEEEINKAKKAYREEHPDAGSNIPDNAYRGDRQPLLMLHLLDCRLINSETSLFPRGISAYGVSFPGKAGSKRPEKLAEYIVNTIWWQNEYFDTLDDEEDVEN